MKNMQAGTGSKPAFFQHELGKEYSVSDKLPAPGEIVAVNGLYDIDRPIQFIGYYRRGQWFDLRGDHPISEAVHIVSWRHLEPARGAS